MSRKTVMIVEDDHDVREALAEALDDAGFEVVLAENGALGLAALRARDALPCVILLDLMMPVMDGRQFRDAQRADPRLAGVPVIVLSAHANGHQTARELAVAEFLAKPIRLEALMAAVRRHAA